METAAIVYEFPSLSQTFVLDQIEGMMEAGCTMKVYADNADPRAVMPPGRRMQIPVSYFGLPLKRVRESVGEMRSDAVRTSSAPPADGVRGRVRRAVERLRLQYEARAFGDRRRFDVIHAHFGPNGVRAVRLREMGAISGPVLTSFYGYDVGRPGARAGYAQLFAEGERFIALSAYMRDRLIELGCASDRIVVHALGVDVDRFRPERQPRDGARLEILTIARLVEKKGIEYGLRAVSDLAGRGVPVRYTIVGNGPRRRQLERLVSELGMDDIIRFAGPQPRDAVVDLLHRSDVLLAPSVTAADGDAEGTPVAILEAQASGIPVVSTRHAGIPEIVDDGQSGYLVPERDVSGLADALNDLSESPSLRATMGTAGRAIVMGKHDIRALNRRLLALYRELRDSRQAPRTKSPS